MPDEVTQPPSAPDKPPEKPKATPIYNLTMYDDGSVIRTTIEHEEHKLSSTCVKLWMAELDIVIGQLRVAMFQQMTARQAQEAAFAALPVSDTVN